MSTTAQQQSVSVQVRGLRKSYNGVEVLHGVSIEIGEGEFTIRSLNTSRPVF